MGLAAGLFSRLHLVVALLLAIYAGSGISVIETNEVGLVLRFGKLVGRNPADAIHKPGLLFALPRPIDEVVRVEVDKILTLPIDDLYYEVGLNNGDSIDPEKEGYVLTADRNILHARIIARYKISDPIAYALHVADQEALLRNSVLEAVVQATGHIKLDDLLGGGRDDFIQKTTGDAQRRLDDVDAGLKLVSIEYDDLSPARQVMEEFDAVQSAFIASLTAAEQANGYAAQTVPAASAEADSRVTAAHSYAAGVMGRARSGAKAFEEMLQTYRANPSVVKERLYREGIERAFGEGGKFTFVPAPVGDRYTEMRVTISTSTEEEKDD